MKFSPDQEKAARKLREFLSSRDRIFKLSGAAGCGKALRNGSKVQTPQGPRNIEDLVPGDLVFGGDGKPVKVNGVYPQGVRDTYRVTFRDGYTVDCDADHIWTVQTRKMRQTTERFRNQTTRELLNQGVLMNNGDMRFCVPLTPPVEYPEKELPIDPYVLGAFIGDGYDLGRRPTLCSPEMDRFVYNEVRSRTPGWVSVGESDLEHCNYYRSLDPDSGYGNPNRFALLFRGLGLDEKSPGRFIPRMYLEASVDQRVALLRGLMDTDGSCRNNRTTFDTTSPRLASDVAELVQSLGGVAVRSEPRERLDKPDHYSVEHHINVKVDFNPFLLPRKADQWSPSRKNPPSRYIRNIEKVGRNEHTCIRVDAEDGLFLTDHYVVTHNSTVISEVLGDRKDVRYAAPTAKAAQVLRRKGVEAQTLHSLMYQPVEVRDEITGKPKLAFKENPKSPLWDGGIVAVDEASMVPGFIAAKLQEYPIKVIAIGDPYQLPPVKSAGSLLTGEPDALLTQVHRTALDSPVLELATYIREHGRLPKTFNRGATRIVSHSKEVGNLVDFDQVIIGTHKTRFKATDYLRRLRGRESRSPEAGDRVICKRNDPEKGLVNGGQLTVKKVLSLNQDVVYTDLVDDDGLHVSTTAWTHGFTGPRGLEKLEEMSFKDRAENTELWYADAITAHASQGSEWDDILVMDESRVFRQNASKWLYTAVTRASESVVVVKR